MANEWWKNVAFLGNNPFMGGINTLANKFGNNRNLNYDEGLSQWGSPMGDVPAAPDDETPSAVNQNVGTPNIPYDRIMDKNLMRDRGNIDNTMLSRIKGAPLGLLNLITRRQGATESFGGYPGSGFGSRAGLFPQEASNLQELSNYNLLGDRGQDIFGTNVVSQFGDYNKHIADKKAKFTANLNNPEYMARTFAGQDVSKIKTLEDMEAAFRTKHGKNAAIANRLNLYANFGQGTGRGVDQVTE